MTFSSERGGVRINREYKLYDTLLFDYHTGSHALRLDLASW